MATEVTRHQQQHQHQHQHLEANPLESDGTKTIPHGLGLLTTVASLPPKYRSRYLNIKTKYEIPLDLSVKPLSPQSGDINEAPPIIREHTTEGCKNPTTKIKTEVPEADGILMDSSKHNKPMTPPLTPIKRNSNDTALEDVLDELEPRNASDEENPSKFYKMGKHAERCTANSTPTEETSTPTKPIKAAEKLGRCGKAAASSTTSAFSKTAIRPKVTRKLKFDEDTSSPVSGTIIRPLKDITDGTILYSNGDIDPKYNIVEITEETKAELAAIKNIIGDYICKLCRLKFDDAFGLAQHRCACIVLLEYRCPECGKQFNCPANLASHRRWHKPRKDTQTSALPKEGKCSSSDSANNSGSKKENQSNGKIGRKSVANVPALAASEALSNYNCPECGKKFKRLAYMRKHQVLHNRTSTKSLTTNNKANCENTTSSTVTPAPTSTATTTALIPILKISNSTALSGGLMISRNAELRATSELNLECLPLPQTTSTQHSLELQQSSYDIDSNCLSDYSNSSYSSASTTATDCGRLQIIESDLTEKENIAAAALTNLRNSASVIQHTTMAH